MNLYNKKDIEGIGKTSYRARVRLIDILREKGIKNSNVLQVILQTPRHLFMGSGLIEQAYQDTAAPISCSQTISQPFIVAKMTELMLDKGVNIKRVLEIGTGSGYQAAILARLVPSVVTTERIKTLYLQATKTINALQIKNITAYYCDDVAAVAHMAPFDAIMVTCAMENIPTEFNEIMKEGGNIIAPLGGRNKTQQLTILTKKGKNFVSEKMMDVVFVPHLLGLSD
jgi:protein-L-isoaspartate(D-aspartate) O-methyltransferase